MIGEYSLACTPNLVLIGHGVRASAPAFKISSKSRFCGRFLPNKMNPSSPLRPSRHLPFPLCLIFLSFFYTLSSPPLYFHPSIPFPLFSCLTFPSISPFLPPTPSPLLPSPIPSFPIFLSSPFPFFPFPPSRHSFKI